MMSIQELYSAVVDEEKVAFCVKDEKLSLASKAIGTCYNQQSLKEGSTYIDYNETANRCAYLYRFGVLHTNMVIKYFQQLLEIETVKNTLESKKSLNVCCLGGGPGTDIVGIFKVLAGNRSFRGKVENVAVLDICGGWRNTFKRIISHLTGGKVEDVPLDFVDGDKFSAKLVQADLLQTPLPSRVVQKLAEADIVCMVKFASAVIGKPESRNAFKVIGESLKLGSIVLFIDNSNEGKIFMQRLPLNNYCGLQIALGPLHESYRSKQKVPGQTIQHYKKQPLKITNISVIGWVKATSTNQDGFGTRDENIEEISRMTNTEKYLCDSTIPACYDSVSNGTTSQKPMKHESTQTEMCPRLDMCDTDMLIDLYQLLNRTEILLNTLNKLNSANAELEECCCKRNH